MNSFDEQLSRALLERRAQGLWRSRAVLQSPQSPSVLVDGRSCLSFCSNDYLGLANHPEVVKAFQQAAERYGVGSGASHLVSGHSRAHQALEEELAEFTGRPRALLFGSGYQANVGVLTALAGAGDLVLEDRLNHASLLDGGLFSGARFRRYPHSDTTRLRALLEAEAGSGGKRGAEMGGARDEDKAAEEQAGRTAESAGKGRCFVVSDGVFSMDGDLAPLPALIEASRGRALLMLDDAHGFGVLGREGGGTLAHFHEQGFAIEDEDCPVLIGTLGKAFGTAGAFVAGSEALVEYLIQFCRHYIYTTALPPAIAEATRVSLKLLRGETWRRERLRDFVLRFRAFAQDAGFPLTKSETPIQALILGSAERAMDASARLRERGIHVGAIRPPTVPEGTARLRITFSAAHSEAQFQALLDALAAIAPAAASRASA